MKFMRSMLLAQYGIIIGLFINSSLFAAFEFKEISWSAAAANIRVVGPPHPDRYLINPALMHAGLQSQLGIQYQKPFAGLDLQAVSLSGVTRPLAHPTISSASYLGDDIYSELSINNGFYWPFDSTFQSGFNIQYFHLGVAGYTNQQAFSLSVSFNMRLTDQISLGSALQHVMQWSKSLEIPQKFHLGVDYDTGPLTVLLALEKEAALPLETCVAILSSPVRKWQLALGYRDLSRTISLGWRIRLKNHAIHYTWLHHPDLPNSYGFGLEIQLP